MRGGFSGLRCIHRPTRTDFMLMKALDTGSALAVTRIIAAGGLPYGPRLGLGAVLGQGDETPM
jgi:hypothetical protein